MFNLHYFEHASYYTSRFHESYDLWKHKTTTDIVNFAKIKSFQKELSKIKSFKNKIIQNHFLHRGYNKTRKKL